MIVLIIVVVGLIILWFVLGYRADRKCPICRKEFKHPDQMHSHFEWMHPEAMEKYGKLPPFDNRRGDRRQRDRRCSG